MNWIQKMAVQIMTIHDVPAFVESQGGRAYLKYVRVSGEYRFSDATISIGHDTLSNGEPVEGAAFVKIYPEGLYVEGSSTTLRVGPAKDDEQNLAALLGIPIKDRWS